MSLQKATIFYDIQANLKPLQSGLSKAGTMALSATRTIAREIAKGTAILAAATTAYGILAIKTASDAQEINGKFSTVFKELTGEANLFANAFADSVGRARQDIKQMMSGLQDLLVPIGYSRAEALKLGSALVSLAVDVASFNNEADSDVMANFQSALIGNTEGVRKYGIIISDVSMRQEHLNSGSKKRYKNLTDLEKIQLRYNILFNSSKDSMGDAIRTGDGFANQVKRLRANFKNFNEEIGNIFLPMATKAIVAINKWVIANKALIVEKVITYFNLVKQKVSEIIQYFKSDDWNILQKKIIDNFLKIKNFIVDAGTIIYKVLKPVFDFILNHPYMALALVSFAKLSGILISIAGTNFTGLIGSFSIILEKALLIGAAIAGWKLGEKMSPDNPKQSAGLTSLSPIASALTIFKAKGGYDYSAERINAISSAKGFWGTTGAVLNPFATANPYSSTPSNKPVRTNSDASHRDIINAINKLVTNSRGY